MNVTVSPSIESPSVTPTSLGPSPSSTTTSSSSLSSGISTISSSAKSVPVPSTSINIVTSANGVVVTQTNLFTPPPTTIPTTTSDASPSSNNTSSQTVGIAVGISIVVLTLVIALLVLFFLRRNKQKKREAASEALSKFNAQTSNSRPTNPRPSPATLVNLESGNPQGDPNYVTYTQSYPVEQAQYYLPADQYQSHPQYNPVLYDESGRYVNAVNYDYSTAGYDPGYGHEGHQVQYVNEPTGAPVPPSSGVVTSPTTTAG